MRTDLIAADGTELAPLEVSLPSVHADLFDPTATPGVPVLVALAAARGEDLHIDGSVDCRMAFGAAHLASWLSARWGTVETKVEVAGTHDATSAGGGVGLVFTADVESWSTLLDLLDQPANHSVTHLLDVVDEPDRRAAGAGAGQGPRRAAEVLGVGLVEITTSARPLLAALRPWADVADLALVSAGLVAGAGLNRLILPAPARGGASIEGPSDRDLLARLSTTATGVEPTGACHPRHERIARVLGDERVRSSVRVCDDGRAAGGCGRCLTCLMAMSALALAGDPDPRRGFDAPLDVARVRELHLTAADDAGLAAVLARELRPEHEELRRAWVDVVARSHDEAVLPRWGDDGPPPMAGPGVPQRVAAALRASTGQADAPMHRSLGWRPGSVPLRPALVDHQGVRSRATQGPRRDRPWAVVEPHIRDGRRDGAQVDLALRAHAAFGPGPCYLPGILWAHTEPPVLGEEAVAALLGTARCRLWWREGGDLEPLRVVESIEHGCLPLQVMPTGSARDLRAALPAVLAQLVVADDELAGLDLSPDAVAARLTPALDHLLAGNAERDLMVGAHGG